MIVDEKDADEIVRMLNGIRAWLEARTRSGLDPSMDSHVAAGRCASLQLAFVVAALRSYEEGLDPDERRRRSLVMYQIGDQIAASAADYEQGVRR